MAVKQLDLTEAERAFLTEMIDLGNDDAGNEVLVGLTVEESVYLIDRSRQLFFRRKPTSKEDARRAVELRERHEIARLTALGRKLAKD